MRGVDKSLKERHIERILDPARIVAAQLVVLHRWTQLKVVADEYQLLERWEKGRQNVGFEHFSGFFAHHHLASQFPQQRQVPRKPRRRDSDDVRLVETSQVHVLA